jgi:hypothetical protein
VSLQTFGPSRSADAIEKWICFIVRIVCKIPERQDLLVKKLQDPLPDFEPDSKMVVFDLVLYIRSGALQRMIKD